ncbi:MAG: glycosyltransferase [Rhodocyclales bacterium]|nr:glycosyltransferase [Rhodocyclales bacterium]
MKISIIIPVLNEAESIPTLYAEINAELSQLDLNAELIFIDDGSSDATPHILQNLAESDESVICIRHLRTLGKSAAYAAGFQIADGEIIVTMDGDLQDDPKELPNLLQALETDADIVIGWKQNRFGNEFGKALPSRVFNWLLNWTFGIRLHDSNCGYRAMRSDVARNLTLFGGYYRFIPEMAHAKGFRVKEIPVAHRRRVYGSSKYGLARFWTSVFDILALRFSLSFQDRPLQAFGSIAAIFMIAGSTLEAYVLWQKIQGNAFQTHLAALITGIFLLIIGVQILAIGLIGVMLAAHRYDSSTGCLSNNKRRKPPVPDRRQP